ncbi:MAG: hypothetical protein M3409_06110 [Gemmatimonadota bacterium]|jgi:hypothetical protein|nr:hypothetical protein [Gemmatimonadota bacterium]
MAKKKRPSAPQMHRQIQDSIQALPYAIADHEKNGRRGKAVLLRYFGAPMLRLMNRIFNRQRYRGEQGAKRRQTEQMKRHLEQREQAMRHLQKTTPKNRKPR